MTEDIGWLVMLGRRVTYEILVAEAGVSGCDTWSVGDAREKSVLV